MDEQQREIPDEPTEPQRGARENDPERGVGSEVAEADPDLERTERQDEDTEVPPKT